MRAGPASNFPPLGMAGLLQDGQLPWPYAGGIAMDRIKIIPSTEYDKTKDQIETPNAIYLYQKGLKRKLRLGVDKLKRKNKKWFKF